MAAEIAVISTAASIEVNSLLFVIQYDSDPHFASQVFYFSTIIRSITVIFVIFFIPTLHLTS